MFNHYRDIRASGKCQKDWPRLYSSLWDTCALSTRWSRGAHVSEIGESHFQIGAVFINKPQIWVLNYILNWNTRVQCRQASAVAARHVCCRHSVTHRLRRNKATSASDRRPSAPRVLSGAGKLIQTDIYTGPTSFLIDPQTFPSFVIYPSSLSFCRSARLFTERSLLHIMSRHAPYCWLATSLFWYSAPTQFSKTF